MEDNFYQYYPTYKFKERDIVLKELESAQKIAEMHSQLFGRLANILLAVVTISFTFILKYNNNLGIIEFNNFIGNYSMYFTIIFTFFGYLLLVYFVELQKTITINARKVVVLRRMLGLDYGLLQFVLPNWRIEGASNPLALRIFPGWFTVVSLPFWIIVVSINLILYISLHNIIDFWYLVNLGVLALFAFRFRKSLCDNHETIYLLFIKTIALIINLRLVKNFEYIIYRAKLSIYELERLKINILNIKKILVAIEDKRFYNHKGVDTKALFRGCLSRLRYFRNKKSYLLSGGSTISMQLARTLFIKADDYYKIYRRKLIEVLLAFWLDNQFSKDLILGIYLSSVRFEKDIFGIIPAYKYFFDSHRKNKFSNEEAFFLVERLSNTKSSYDEGRVEGWAVKIKREIMPEFDIEKLFNLYKHIELKHLIKREI